MRNMKFTTGAFALLLSTAMVLNGCMTQSNSAETAATNSESTATTGKESLNDQSGEASDGIASGSNDTQTSESTGEIVSVNAVEYKKKDLETSYDEASATLISLNGTGASVNGSGASADGSTVTITEKGDYLISGTLSDGQIIVEADDKADVRLILNGVNIHCETSACIYIKNCDKCIITLAEGSVNTLTDGSSYVYDDAEKEEPNAVIFSCDDLSLNGEGVLNITANFKHAVRCKDDLKVTSGTYNISANGDGLKAKDTLAIKDGTITISKSNEGIEALSIVIDGGDISVTASDDGLNAAGSSSDSGSGFGGFGGGDMFAVTEGAQIVINGGNLYVNAKGDGIDSNGHLYVNGGNIMVDGPVDGANGALDHNGDAIITGGTLVASGSNGMVENFDSNSTQNVILAYFSSQVQAGSEIVVKDSTGKEIISFTNAKTSQCAIMSSAEITIGETYTVYVNGTEDCSVESTAVISANGSTGTGFGGGFGGFGGGGFGGNFGGGKGGKDGSSSERPEAPSGDGSQIPDSFGSGDGSSQFPGSFSGEDGNSQFPGGFGSGDGNSQFPGNFGSGDGNGFPGDFGGGNLPDGNGSNSNSNGSETGGNIT